MTSTCPRACSRLTAAAVFVSVGVVQFLAGMILLRSEFVYLLSGPDFWTAVCNVAVGGLLGISANVWKQRRKFESKKHILRRHLLLSLLLSGLLINVTTLGILLIEGNDHLSIRLETDGEMILAYAYATSVCCPIICIVISIVTISGSCFRSSRSSKKKSDNKKFYLNSPKKNRSRSLQWIYSQERPNLSKNQHEEPVLSTSSESSSDGDDDGDANTTKPSKYVDDLQNVLNRMAEGRRDSILRDSTIMLRQLDQRRKNKYYSSNLDESYMGTTLSHVKESGTSERPIKSFSNHSRYSNYSGTGNPKLYISEIAENARFPAKETSTKSRSRDEQLNMQQRNAYVEFTEHRNDPPSFIENSSLQCRSFKEKAHSRPKIADNSLSYGSDTKEHDSKIYTASVHKKAGAKDWSRKSILKRSSDGTKKNEPFQDYHEVVNEKKIKRFNGGNNLKETPQVSDDCFSPEDSDFSPDLELTRRTSSWAGEIVPIQLRNSSLPRLSLKLIPVASPTVPSILPGRDQPSSKISDDSGISSIQSTSFSSEIANQNELKDRENNLSTFQESPKMGDKENVVQYPKSGLQISKKHDLSRMVTMASISEEPNTELNSLEKAHGSSFYGNTRTKMKGYCRQQSLPSEFPSSSKEAQSDEDSSEINETPKRKRSASGKALRKLWSLATPENHDFLNQVVDNDSLIGLSEEELIARQLKNRSIRKAVQLRLKEEMIMMENNCTDV